MYAIQHEIISAINCELPLHHQNYILDNSRLAKSASKRYIQVEDKKEESTREECRNNIPTTKNSCISH